MKKMKSFFYGFLLLLFGQQAFAQAPMYYKWVNGIAGNNSRSVATDANGDVYMAGLFSGIADFDPGPNTFSLNSATGNGYLVKYNRKGGFLWAINFGGSFLMDMALDASGNIHIIGMSNAGADFNPTAAVSALTNPLGQSNTTFIVKYNSAGSLLWVRGVENQYGNASICVDPSGNVFIGDAFDASIALNPASSAPSVTGSGHYIAKFNSSGIYQWAKPLNSTTTLPTGVYVDFRIDLKCDNIGNVVAAGVFYNTFVPAQGVQPFVHHTSTNLDMKADVYVAKFDPAGTYMWSFILDGYGASPGFTAQTHGLAIDQSGNVYIGGIFNGTGDFDPSAAIASVTGGGNFFAAKYNSNGVYQWAKNLFPTPLPGTSRDITLDAAGNIYIASEFMGTAADFDPSAGVATLSTVDGRGVIAQYTTNGDYIKAVNVGAGGSVIPKAVAHSMSDNSFYVSGVFSGASSDFDPSSGVYNIADLTNGTFLEAFDTSPDIKVSANSGVISSGSTFNPCIVPVNQSKTTTYTISNPALYTTITITGPITISGANASDFTINQSGLNTTINGGSSTTFTVTFTPTAVGTRTAVLSIPSNDPDENPYIINLSGIAAAATSGPLAITGSNAVCPGMANVTYSIASPVSGYTYTWNVPMNVAIASGQGTSSIVVNFGPNVGINTISVTENAGSPCQGATASYNVDVTTSMPPVTAITGPSDFCPNTSGIVYSVPFHAGSTYTWTIPAGFYLTSGQGTNSITIGTVNLPTSGNITVTEVSCSSTSTASKAITARTYRLETAGMVCGANGKGYLTLLSYYPVRAGIIGLDFAVTYDPTKISPTGLATMGSVATSYGSYSINALTPGTMYVSVYLNGAPASAMFNGSGNIITLEFQQQAGFTVGTTTSIGLNNLEESTALNSIQVCSGFTTTMGYTGSYNGQLYFRNTSNVIPGGSGQTPMAIYPADAGCYSFSNPVGSVDASGILRYNSAQSTTIQLTRDITGDKDVLPLNCTNVQAVINSTDRNMALQISNYSISTPSIYQLMAADVNLDGKVTAGDASLISSRSVNAGYCEFPQAWNYTFNGTLNVPASNYRKSLDWVFLNQSVLSTTPYTSATRNSVPVNPRCIGTGYVNPGACNASVNANFVGVLLGDVDGNWTSSANGATTRTNYAQSVIVDLDQATLAGYNTYRIPVRYSGVTTVEGIDLSVDYDGAELDITAVGNNPVAALGVTWNDLSGEKLMISSYNEHGINSTSAVLYITVTTNGDFPTEAYLGSGEAYINGEPANFLIQRNGTVTNTMNGSVSEMSITVSPNPYEHQAIVKVEGITEQAIFTLYDLSGRRIEGNHHQTGDGEFMLDENLPAGVYVVEVNSGDAVARVKVIKQ